MLWGVLGKPIGPEFVQLLDSAFPERFAAPKRGFLDQAEWYPEALLRAVVARSFVEQDEPTADGRAAKESTAELLAMLRTPGHTFRIVTLVTDVNADAVAGAKVRGVRIETDAQQLELAVSPLMPEAVWALERRMLVSSPARTSALLVSDESSRDLWEVTDELRHRVHSLVTALRLLTAGTVHEVVDWRGQPGMVHVAGPEVFNYTWDEGSYWRRPVTLTGADLPALGKLAAIVDRIDTPSGKAKNVSPLVVAIGRFNRSLRPALWQDKVVDLAVALEAALVSEKVENTLRLRTRAARLLAVPDDPAEAIFDDVGDLYAMRSMVVHGEPVPAAEWHALFKARGLTQLWDIEKQGVVLDRWRDLVRRAILARILLSDVTSASERWPLIGSFGVDRALVSDAQRKSWRQAIRHRARVLGGDRLWRPASPLIDCLHTPSKRDRLQARQ